MTIEIYREDQSSYSKSTAIKDVPFRLLTEGEAITIKAFYTTMIEAAEYPRVPPPEVEVVLAELKMVGNMKDIHIGEAPSFSETECCLIAAAKPVKNDWRDRVLLIARWSRDNKDIMSLRDIREKVKVKLITRRKALLSSALAMVEEDVDSYLTDGSLNNVGI